MNGNNIERMINLINGASSANETKYSGYYFAFYGAGGFATDQSFNPIRLSGAAPASFSLYDVTHALQVRFDVRTLNEKLGLIKDASNIGIISSVFNPDTGSFPIDTITINANEFVNGMKAEQVISLGAYTTLYSDYLEYTNSYFSGNMTTDDYLFSSTDVNDMSGGNFDANSFMDLITHGMTGIITISNIDQLLRYAVNSNVFNNRIPIVPPIHIDVSNSPVSIADLSSGTFYDVSDNLMIESLIDISNNIATFSFVDSSHNITTNVVDDLLNNIKTTTVVDSSNNVTTVTVVDLNNNTSKITINDLSDNFVTIINTNLLTNEITTTAENLDTNDGDVITTTNAINNTNPDINSLVDISFSPVPGKFGINDGFIAGDLIFIPAGTTIQLQLLVNPMIDASINIIDIILNAGLAREFGLATAETGIDQVRAQSLNYSAQTSVIQRILTAPLLIELDNIS